MELCVLELFDSKDNRAAIRQTSENKIVNILID